MKDASYAVKGLSAVSAALVMILSSSCAWADTALESYLGEDLTLELSQDDRQTLNALKALNIRKGSAPLVHTPGEAVFIHGAGQHTVVCAVLQLTDIALEPGEIITSVQLGDTARWFVDAAVSGAAENAVQHLIIKPADSGLSTSLVVTTDRRTYHLNLKSTSKDFMPSVRFVYPGSALVRLNALKQKRAEEERRLTIPGTAVTLDKLSFAYECSGDEELLPIRVFNDGTHTFIEMPEKLPQGRMPALVILHDQAFIGQDRTSIANYRVQGSRLVVDSLFNQAKLILGDGDETLEAVITKQEGKS